MFDRIVFNGSGYTLNGNALTVRTQFSGPGAAIVINLPLTVDAGRTIDPALDGACAADAVQCGDRRFRHS
ncbi:MAG: hypothetical protein IPK97_15180 [Ahniella sp.]|nr:hypothetical protein [Ahniella sp.]